MKCYEVWITSNDEKHLIGIFFDYYFVKQIVDYWAGVEVIERDSQHLHIDNIL